MGKFEMKANVVKQFLANVAGSYSSYTYGKIPSALAQNACKTYAGAVRFQNILGLIDTSILGDGKKGMLFTDHAVYYNNGFFNNPKKISYQEIYETSKISSEVFYPSYNSQALKELLSLLAQIEGGEAGGLKRFSRKIASLNNQMSNVEGTVDQIGETVNSVVNILDGVSNILSIFADDGNQTKRQ